MRGFRLTIVAVLAMTLFASRSPAVAADRPPETGLGAGQLLIGTATASIFVVLPVFAADTPFATFSYGLLFVGPAAVGGMVCTFGQTSKHYTGRCAPVLIGAYLGALAALPLAWLGSASDSGSFKTEDEGHDFTSGGAIGFAVGYTIGAALGATIAWHMKKEERELWAHLGAPPAAPPLESLRWSELVVRPAPGARAARFLTVPLLAFTF